MFFWNTNAFLWEDLWLELYKNIDEGLWELERKQYEYELTGQWESSVNEVVAPALALEGIQCEVNSVWDINRLIWEWEDDHINFVVERCFQWDDPVPAVLAERVANTMRYIRRSYSDRAINKSRRTYEIARIGLYHDGNIENSPFDLIHDIQEIDKIIFGEEIEYEGVPYEKSADEALDDFLNEDKDYLYEDEEDEEDTGTGTTDEETGTGTIIDDEVTLLPDVWDHRYVCAPDTSGLDTSDILDILEDIGDSSNTGSTYTPVTHVWEYPDTELTNNTSWGGPFPGVWPNGSFTPTKDGWKCGDFFCIIIEFQKSQYGLAGGETQSIAKVLGKIAEHLEKPANASLTQRKMTTNNFELGSIIKDLPGMLRGFGIEVQSKPIPILDLESDNDSWVAQGDVYELENMIRSYYKNNGMDYERRNDLGIFGNDEAEQKVFETARGMPTVYPEVRIAELEQFTTRLRENNRVLSQSVDNEIQNDAFEDFNNQFAELEKFVTAMKEFVEAISGVVGEMNKIPTRSS